MHKNTSVTLGEHLTNFVDCQVNAGRFSSTSEVVRAALRLLEERELAIQNLRNALLEGEESGEPIFFDVEQFLKSKRPQHAKKHDAN